VKVIAASVRVAGSARLTSLQLARSVPDTTPAGTGRAVIRAVAAAGAASASAAIVTSG
jgi:hypothetical protein